LDLAQGRLRHVSEAFVEDPVRVLRLARFATRFASFEIAESTLALCHSMAASGELDALVSERVWAELSQALMYAQPSRMVLALVEMHALAKIWPKLDQARYSDAYRDALNGLAPLALRFAVLCLAMRPEAVKHSLQSLKVPNRCGFWADWAVHRLGQLWGIRHHRPEDVLGFIQSLDALRQPERVESLRVLASAWAHSGAQADSGEADVQFLHEVLAQMDRIDAQALAAQGLSGPQMADAISQARLACIERCQSAVD
jgi:tRNA nucleotidyltransferase (CCA-adding enzyme)